MKKILSFILIILCVNVAAQNVGIGTINPQLKLHVSGATASDSALLMLENNVPLSQGVNTGMYFRNSNYVTGAIKTIGTNINSARLGFFSYASNTSSGLKERMSILDNGNVGINNINPQFNLDIAGTFNIDYYSRTKPTATFSNTSSGNGAILARLGNPTGFFLYSATITAESDSTTFVPAVHAVSKSSAISAESDHAAYTTIYAQNSNATVPTVARLYGNVEVNKTTYAPTNSGNLKVEGVFNYPGNAGAGKVLTSDANGNASWKSSSSKALLAYLSADLSVVGTNAPIAIPFNASLAGGFNDFGAASLNAAGKFTVPAGEAGLYQISLNVRWNNANNYAGTQAYSIAILKNQGTTLATTYNYLYSNSNSLENRDLHTSITLKLAEGDGISLSASQFSGLAQLISSGAEFTYLNIVRLN